MTTTNEKIKATFEKLLIYLQPKETSKQNSTYWSCVDNKRHTYTVKFAECSFLNCKNIPLPYSDILVEVTEQNICIIADNLEYNFAPDQILTIWNRIKKTLN
jgi:ABC-type long-subunit fatty acid transport system fused permease/ATPase subunit